MSTIYKILDPIVETLWEFIAKYNNSIENLNTDKAEKSGGTFTWDIIVPDEVYDATAWNWSLEVPTKNAIRDKIEAMPSLSDWDKGDITVSSGTTVWTIDPGVVTNSKQANMSSGYFKGRTTVWSGSPEDLTATQATALLDNATTSLKGLMSPADKTKLDAVPTWVGIFCWVLAIQTSTWTITDNSLDLINFDNELYDTDAFHNTITNNGRLTVPTGKAWKYDVRAQIETTKTDDTVYYTLAIYKNWTITHIKNQKFWQKASWPVFQDACAQVSGFIDLSVWDYLELYVSQNFSSGADSTTVAAWTWFWMTKMG